MSGLVAIINMDGAPVDTILLHRLVNALESRGRDARSSWVQGAVGLGHALHKTTREAEFEQHPATLEGQVWLISSARIDGRDDLIKKLGLSRLKAEETPDTVLILHAYQTWGEQCIHHLLGDFAFVIWDARCNKLFCARDRFGMRQLYFAKVGNAIIISNSLYCLLHYSVLAADLDDQVIGDFLLFGDPAWMDREKNRTAFRNIHKVPPAHTLIISNRKPATKQYWQFPRELPLLVCRNDAEYIARFRELFKQVIQDRMRYRDTVISMSGGMDSTSIAALASQCRDDESGSINLSVVTASYEGVYPDEEAAYARLVAEKLGLPIQFIQSSAWPFLDTPVLTTRPMEFYQPGLWLETQRLLAMNSRVCLAGYAGDNLMKPTPLFRLNKSEWRHYHVLQNLAGLYRQYRQLPALGSGLMTTLRSLQQRAGSFKSLYPPWLNDSFAKEYSLQDRWNELYSRGINSSHPRHPAVESGLMEPDWNTDDIQMRSDFVFPEERDPFLDLRLVEFILSLPPLPWLFHKHLLREAMQGLLPEAVLRRPKSGMGGTLLYFLELESSTWADHWIPMDELKRYIARDRVPRLCKTTHFQHAVISIRPLILNQWLAGIQRLKEDISISNNSVNREPVCDKF